MAVSDERMDLPGKQVDSGQQAQRAMTFVLDPAPRSRGRRAWAANRVLWLRWPGFPAFRRRKLNRLQTASPNISWTDVENDLVAAYCRVVARKLGLAAA